MAKLKAYSSMKPPKKSLDSLAGKLNLNWPYSPALPQRPKFKFYFPAKECKDFLAGFIEKCTFKKDSEKLKGFGRETL